MCLYCDGPTARINSSTTSFRWALNVVCFGVIDHLLAIKLHCGGALRRGFDCRVAFPGYGQLSRPKATPLGNSQLQEVGQTSVANELIKLRSVCLTHGRVFTIVAF